MRDVEKQQQSVMLGEDDMEKMLWKNTHRLFHDATGEDSGEKGLKYGFTTFAGNWYICSALSMTIGFALIIFDPPGVVRTDDHTVQHANGLTFIARSAYVILVLGGIMTSTVGAIICAYWLDDLAGIPASSFPDYLAAAGSPDTRMTSTYSYPLLGLKLNLYALLPLCYLQHSLVGFITAVVMCLLFLVIIASENRKRNNLRWAFNERIGFKNTWQRGVCDCTVWGIPYVLGTVFSVWDEA